MTDWNEGRKKTRGVLYNDGVFVPLEKHRPGNALFSICEQRDAKLRKDDLKDRQQGFASLTVMDKKKVTIGDENVEQVLAVSNGDTDQVPESPKPPEPLATLVAKTVDDAFPNTRLIIHSRRHAVIIQNSETGQQVILPNTEIQANVGNASNFLLYLSRKVAPLIEKPATSMNTSERIKKAQEQAELIKQRAIERNSGWGYATETHHNGKSISLWRPGKDDERVYFSLNSLLMRPLLRDKFLYIDPKLEQLMPELLHAERPEQPLEEVIDVETVEKEDESLFQSDPADSPNLARVKGYLNSLLRRQKCLPSTTT